MTSKRALLERLLSGTADSNIPFEGLRNLLGSLGFQERISGGHHIFSKSDVQEILNLQPKSGKAKAYQVKQARAIIVHYKLGEKP
jgi:hypothetical protein